MANELPRPELKSFGLHTALSDPWGSDLYIRIEAFLVAGAYRGSIAYGD